MDYYDLNWNYIDIVPKRYRSKNGFEKPQGLNEMITIARKLSSKFSTSRIDFYDINGKVYVGEITLSPAACNLYYVNNTWQKKFGDKIDLNSEFFHE